MVRSTQALRNAIEGPACLLLPLLLLLMMVEVVVALLLAAAAALALTPMVGCRLSAAACPPGRCGPSQCC
jgi:hypothetical protein